MAQQVEIDNFGPLNTLDPDQLQADSLPNTSQILTDNTAIYVVGQYIVVGPLGTELAELKIIQSIDDATHMTFTTPLALKHFRFDPLTALNGNQIRIYRAANVDGHVPADSSFTVLGTVGIATNQMITLYVDQTGDSNWWYKSTYYNTVTTYETSLAESTVARGGGYNFYCSIYEIRKSAGLLGNQYITDAEIDAKRKEAQDEINAALSGMYNVPFQPPVDSMITGITRLMAAGKLLNDEYGPGTAPMSGEGAKKLNDAMVMLNLIDSRQYILNDITGQSLLSPNSQSSKSFPDKNTALQNGQPSGSDRNFRMSDVQGDYARKY
jgi:hypothetical protein